MADGQYNAGIDELNEWVGGDAIFRDYTMQSNVDLARSKPIDLPGNMAILKENKPNVAAKVASMGDTMLDIDAVLSATGSARFYTGDEAQKGVATRERIQATITDLSNALTNLNDDDVGRAIAKYNADLKILKKKSKLMALQQHVDTINGRKVDEGDYITTYYPGYGTYMPQSHPEGNYYVTVTNTKISTETQSGVTIEKYNTHWVKTVNIDYDGLIKSNADTTSFLNIKKWFDDSYEKLAKKVESVDSEYPGNGFAVDPSIVNMGDDVPDEWCVWSGQVY